MADGNNKCNLLVGKSPFNVNPNILETGKYSHDTVIVGWSREKMFQFWIV